LNFSSFGEFLATTSNYDREFLGDDFSRIAQVSCAMSNSSGGLIILGAEIEFDDEIKITGFFHADLSVINSLIPRGISFEVQNLEKILIIKISPLSSRQKPIFLNGILYRRVEGVNLISSRRSAMLMTYDPSFDDQPAMNFSINTESVNDFYETMKKIDSVDTSSIEDFLCRSYIFSGKFLTFAGALMFGNIITIRAVLDTPYKYAELEARNIWDAYKNILPRLVKKLSPGCSQAFQEIFINSLLHSDYRAGNLIEILITSNPPKVSIINPGIIHDEIQNHRLKKFFSLAGLLVKGRNLETVKKFMPSFKLEQDMLNFRVKALLNLEGISKSKNLVIL